MWQALLSLLDQAHAYLKALDTARLGLDAFAAALRSVADDVSAGRV